MRNVLEKFFNRGVWVFSLFFAIAQRKETKPRVSEQKESLLTFSSESGLSKRKALCRCANSG